MLGFQPLQLVTRKIVMILGLTMGVFATDSMYDDEIIRNIMATDVVTSRLPERRRMQR